MPKKKILIIDDDTRLRNLLGKYLDENNFNTTLSGNTNEASKILNDNIFDLIIVDVMMPQEDGITFTSKISKISKTPIIILTARGDFSDRISGLEAGADDYLAKPFEPKELLLRINNILKRNQSIEDNKNICKFGDYIFDMSNLKLNKSSEFIYLTQTESKILHILCKNKGKVVSREELSKSFDEIDDRTIDVQITRLRKKLESNPKKPQFLETIRGQGYIIK